MNYIYDIVLNFQDNYYQFFEWNRTDKIKNISKIIVYRVSDKDLKDLTYNQITIDIELLKKIKEENKKNQKIMCLVSNTKQSIGLLFSEEGILLKRSSLLFGHFPVLHIQIRKENYETVKKRNDEGAVMNNFPLFDKSFKHEKCQGGWSDGTGESRNMWCQYSKASASETTGEGSFVCSY